MAGKFQYQRRSEDQWRKRAEQRGGDFLSVVDSSIPTYTPKKGSNWLRILPPTWENPENYGYDIYVHYGVGPDEGSVACLDHLGLEDKCPLCITRARLAFEGNEEVASRMKPARRVAMYVIDRNRENEGPKIWLCPWTIERDIQKISKDQASGQILAIDDPYEGYDITFDREGEGMKVRYTGIAIARRPSSVPESALEFIVAHPVPDTFNYLTAAEINEITSGAVEQPETASAQVKAAAAQAQSDNGARPEQSPAQASAPASEQLPAQTAQTEQPRMRLERPAQPAQAPAPEQAPAPATAASPATSSALQRLKEKMAAQKK